MGTYENRNDGEDDRQKALEQIQLEKLKLMKDFVDRAEAVAASVPEERREPIIQPNLRTGKPEAAGVKIDSLTKIEGTDLPVWSVRTGKQLLASNGQRFLCELQFHDEGEGRIWETVIRVSADNDGTLIRHAKFFMAHEYRETGELVNVSQATLNICGKTQDDGRLLRSCRQELERLAIE